MSQANLAPMPLSSEASTVSAGPYLYPPPRRGFWLLLFLAFLVVFAIIVIVTLSCSGCCSSASSSTPPLVWNTKKMAATNIASSASKVNKLAKNNTVAASAPVFRKSTATQEAPIDFPSPPGYVAVKLPQHGTADYGENITEKYSGLELGSATTQASCLSLCESKADCKGVWYSEGECYLLPETPTITGTGIEKEANLYLKEQYRPVITDRVFLAAVRDKLTSIEWWNMTPTSGGKVAVFQKSELPAPGRTYYLATNEYEVINAGQLVGVYSNRILTEKETRNALAGFFPPGAAVVVDRATSEHYTLNLAKLGTKTVYVKYLAPI